MKRIFTMLAVVVAVLAGTNAMAQEARGNAHGNDADNRNGTWNQQRNTYYFYPYANVYYSSYTHDYWYQKNGRWVSRNRLPRNISLFNQQRVDVMYYDRDGMVWKDNYRHLQQFRYQANAGGHHNQPGVRIDRH